jgi:hypothetical protein
MVFLYTVLITIVSIILLAKIRTFILYRLRAREFKDWQIGDEVEFIIKFQTKIYILGAWSKQFIVVKGGDGNFGELKWSDFSKNLSATRRRKYEICKKDMGKEPGFTPLQKMLTKKKSVSSYNDGKDISLWTETECQTFLKIALDSEDYEFADLIKKRLEYFR